VLLSKLVESWGSDDKDIDPAERRLSVRLLKYWNELRGDRTYPSPDLIRFGAVPELQEFGFTMSVSEGDPNPTIHYLGSELNKHIRKGLDDAASQAPDESPLSLSLNDAIRRYAEVMERQGPVAFESEPLDTPGCQFAYRAIMLPFSGDNRQIDFILGAIRYKEKLSETTLSQSFESGLAKSLRECRDLASTWRAEETKSRTVLYETLERAYQFQFEALEDVHGYEDLCAKAGVNFQSRAPFTPVIKLVFGAEYDKTRISEYAACLSYAKRNNQEPGTLRALLEATEGGIKGCVKAERAARREERSKGPDNLSKAKDLLRELNPLMDMFAGGSASEEFVLLLARREPADSNRLHVLCALEEKPSVIEPIIKRAAKALKSTAK
jgi:hypothetical protein